MKKAILNRLALAVLLVAPCGCENSSGTVGKHKIGVGNLLVIEGEGFSWDNRVPATQPAATQPSQH